MRLLKLSIVIIILGVMASCRFMAPRSSQTTVSPTEQSVTATSNQPTLPIPTGILPAALNYNIGRNDYTITLEGVPRKYIIYVPGGYDSNRPTPVVFMFHGSNQSGQLMYEVTGWAAKADAENFIVVYPTSWKYLVTDGNMVEDKWNAAGLYREVSADSVLKDDVAFVRVLLALLRTTFNVDEQRIFASGFSNGGAFVLSRLLLEMNDTFAAFSTSGAAFYGEGLPDQIPTGIDTSLYSILGGNDQKVSENTGRSLPLPMRAEDIAGDDLFKAMIATTTSVLSLDTTYDVKYEQPGYTTMSFEKSLIGAENEYIFRMVAGMGHVYPSGDNNRAGLNAADLFWDFFMEHTKP